MKKVNRFIKKRCSKLIVAQSNKITERTHFFAYHSVDLVDTFLRFQVLVEKLAGVPGPRHETLVQVTGYKWSCNTWLSTLQEVRIYSQTSGQWTLNVSTIRSNRLMRRDLCEGNPRCYADFEKVWHDRAVDYTHVAMIFFILYLYGPCASLSSAFKVQCNQWWSALIRENSRQWENLQQFRAIKSSNLSRGIFERTRSFEHT